MGKDTLIDGRHQILTILFTDIKDYTVKTNSLSRQDLEEMLRRHRAVVIPVVEAHHGRVLEEIGDAFLAVFDSPTNAVLAGIHIHEAVEQYNKECVDPKYFLALRAAVNTGEVMFTGDKVSGEAVNVASRLQAVAEVGDVFFTEATYLLMKKSEIPTSEVGYKQFKGLPQKIRVYKVVSEPVELEGRPSVLSQPVSREGIGHSLLAGFFQRGMAAVLDVLIFTLPILLLVAAVKYLQSTTSSSMGSESPSKVIASFGLFCFFLFQMSFLKWRGATPGKFLMKIRVAKRSGGALTWKDVILRQLVPQGLVSLFIFGDNLNGVNNHQWINNIVMLTSLGDFIWALWDKEKRTLHDRVAGTLVILDIR